MDRRMWVILGSVVGVIAVAVGTLDYVGLDYYWGIGSLRLDRWRHFQAAIDCRYGDAPVWAGGLYNLLMQEHRRFPDKPLIVVENGCVAIADGVKRADYLSAHVREVQRAVADGAPVEAYLCWSITSNREWGLPFDDNSDFGLFHIELDRDRLLTRVRTDAADRYAQIIAARCA